MSTDDFSDTAMSTVIPAIYVHEADGDKINLYINNTKYLFIYFPNNFE